MKYLPAINTHYQYLWWTRDAYIKFSNNARLLTITVKSSGQHGCKEDLKAEEQHVTLLLCTDNLVMYLENTT